MDQKWLADGSAVLVLDAGEGVPGDEGYRPALVARLATEQHEPGQVLDSDPLEDTLSLSGPTATGSGIPGEVRGAVAPQAPGGPAAATVLTRSTAAEDPNVTTPGGPATGGLAGLLTQLSQLSDEELARVRSFFRDEQTPDELMSPAAETAPAAETVDGPTHVDTLAAEPGEPTVPGPADATAGPGDATA